MSTLPFQSPKFRAFDANGDPLSGGKLYSYAAGTSTPLDTYTTRAGDVANSNPVILDANGEADVWTAQGVLYKFVLTNSANVVQWTVDNVPSGSGASGSGGSSTADANSVDPGARLSLTSGTPVTTTDVSGALNVFYVPYKHNQVPLYDGSTWALHTMASELSQALNDTTKSPAAATNGNNYDMFIWDDSGALRVSRGPPWASDTTRGTGAGTTELELVDVRYVNKFPISNGPAAQRGLYVGTIRMASGGVADSRIFRHVWNTYNRMQRQMWVYDAASGWTYTSPTGRQANGNSANQLDFLLGLNEEPVLAEIRSTASNSVGASFGVGLGLGSLVFTNPQIRNQGYSDGAGHYATATAVFDSPIGVGRYTLVWIENGDAIGITSWLSNGASGIFGRLMA